MKMGFIFIAISSFATTSFAQVGLEGFSSGRYEVRKSQKAVTSRKPSSTAGEPVKAEAEEVKEESVAATPAATAVTTTLTTTATTHSESPAAAEPKSSEEPSISEQAESLFSSKAEKIYDFYRSQVHPDDLRNNKVEIEVMPVLSYVDSQSNYAYRSFHSLFNALNLKTNIWFTPSIGVTGQILFSLAADMDSVADSSRVPTKYEFMDVGFNVRRYFGISRLSNSMQFSLLYNENKVNVDSDNTSRPRLKTSGLGLGLKARVPASETYAWTFGGSFFPRLQHSESETGAAISSGASSENIRFGVEVGGEFKFSRENQVLWNLGLSTERNTFDGAAALPDPHTGVTPQNVSVTNSLYMFSLGYRWGH